MRIGTDMPTRPTTLNGGILSRLRAAVARCWGRQLTAWEVFDRHLVGGWAAPQAPPRPAPPASPRATLDPEIAAALRAERIANDYHSHRP